MKKSFVLCILLMLCTLSLTAGPAYPGRITYTQPDGTTIGIHLHGDEYCHWMTDDFGNIVVSDDEGYIRVAGAAELTAFRMEKEASAIQRAKNMAAMKAAASNHLGSPEIPVILIGFKDYPITKTAEQFDAMLNTPGYSDNNAIGSVYDYYNENSFGQFTPHFDVVGSVNLSNNVSTYGNNDGYAYQALLQAMDKLNSSVNFSKYDNDKDGVIDFVIFYFGGYDEAQCPQTSSYTKFIWSHASDISTLGQTFDGVKVGKYFCTSELKGYSGSTMCSIGTTCHEFAHTLGLPDFYDVAYQNGETSTQSANMYDFDLMAGGSYNGTVESTSPPYLNAEELLEIGWLSAIPELTATGSVTLPGINYPGASTYSAYMTKADVSGEYFVFETRRGERWDSPLPTGMMVYHVDKSSNKVSGSVTAASTWDANYVNSYASHPCCYVVPAANPSSTSYYSGQASNFFFPGSRTVRSYSPTAWSGKSIGFQLTNITYSNKVVTFDLVNSNVRGISGVVTNTDGVAIEGATVSISVTSAASAPAQVKAKENSLLSRVRLLFRPSAKRMQSIRRAARTTVTTNSEGVYSVEVEAGTYLVTVSKDGYVSESATVTVTSRIETRNFQLMREGEEVPSVLYAWPTDILTEEDEYIVGSEANSLTGQNLYPSSEIGRYGGKQIKEITFYLYGDQSTTYKGVNVIIDYDNERKATVAVSNDDLAIGGYTTVDLRSLGLIIPSDKDIYAGVGYSQGGYSYNSAYYSFGAFYKTDEDENILDWAVDWPYDGLVSEYNLTATGTRYSWDVIFDFTLTIGDFDAPDTGYNYIDDPKNGTYSAGDVFALTLVETEGARKPGTDITWYLDDEPVSGSSVTLTAGAHVVKARFVTTEGKTKIVELELSAE